MPDLKTPRSRGDSPHAPVGACPVERAILVIGGKWKLLILRCLLLNGPQGFNRLLEAVTNVSAKELTRNLKELAAADLVSRAAGSSPRSTLYSLTEAGKGLMPTFQALLNWGQTALPFNPRR